jgi:hypothetical protein
MKPLQLLCAAFAITASCSDGGNLSEIQVTNPESSPLDSDVKNTFVQITHSRGSCSGVVVGEGIILTAHHCLTYVEGNRWHVVEPKDFQYVYINPEVGVWQNIKVQDLQVHKSKDLGIVRVSGLPASMPKIAMYPNEDLSPKQELIVTGFGAVYINNKRDSEVEKTRTPRWGKLFFQKKVASMVPSNNKKYTDSLQLVGKSVACPGDSGGGIFAKKDETWFLVGINSSSTCTVSNRPEKSMWASDPRNELAWIQNPQSPDR